MADTHFLPRVEAVRRFNRFYTRQIGLLQEGLLRSSYSLTEARILYELAHHEQTTATHLTRELGLDAGYLSRILRSFQKRGLVEKRPSEEDRRRQLLSLTGEGQEVFAQLNTASRGEVATMLEEMTETDQHRLVHAMGTIEGLLGAQPEHRVPYIVRPHQSGDMGWVVPPRRALQPAVRLERGIRGAGGGDRRRLHPQLRLTVGALLDRRARGGERRLGLRGTASGERARSRLTPAAGRAEGARSEHRRAAGARVHAIHPAAGYRAIALWTNSVLDAARCIYEQEGYRMVHEESRHSFGHDQLEQNQELEL